MAWARAVLRLDALVSLAGMIAVLGLTGWLIAGPDGLLMTAAVGLLSVALAPTVPPGVAMRVMGARPVHPDQAPGLYTLLIELAEAAGLRQPPVLYRIPGGSVSALSVGDGERAAIALSDGMTMVMDARELRGVLAHEVAHVAAADTALMTLAAVLGRIVHTLATFGLIAAIVVAVFTPAVVPVWLVLAIALAPWGATLLHLHLSRRREFAADAEAARLTGDPQGLARALVKLETLPRRGLGHLMRPSGGWSRGGWLRTHPSTRDRIERLVGPIRDRVRPLAEL